MSLKNILNNEGLKVVKEEISPRGIVTIYLEVDFKNIKEIGKEHAIFRKLGLNMKSLPTPMNTLLGQSNLVKYRLG